MRTAKFVATVLVLIMSIGLFTGCFNNKYNAVLYDDQFASVKKWINEDFLVENRVNGYYRDENDELIHITDKKSPIVHILTEEEMYNEIFTDCSLEIDFEKQMVILYIFSDHDQRNFRLKSTYVDGTVLQIKIERYRSEKQDHIPDSYQRILMIVMDEVAITDVCIDITLSQFRYQEVKDAFK